MFRCAGRYHLLFCILFICIARPVYAQNFVFAQLNGSPMNTKGWNLAGEAHLVNIVDSLNTELLLCSGFNSVGPYFLINRLTFLSVKNGLPNSIFACMMELVQMVLHFVFWMCRPPDM